MADKLLTIPQIRHCLHALATRLADAEAEVPSRWELAKLLRHLAEQTRRRKSTRRAPPQRAPRPSTQEAQAFMETHPDADQLEAANAFGTNQGRISEALNGFRE